MISSWWDLIFTALIFFAGIGLGRLQSNNEISTNNISYMQDLLDQSYEKQNHIKKMWLDAEEQSETWKRRYEVLASEKETSDGS